MRISKAFDALKNGLIAPEKVYESSIETALAIFALAVFVLATVATFSAYVEDGSADLRAEAMVLSEYGMAPSSGEEGADPVVSTATKTFITVFGGAIMMSLGKIGVLAWVFMVLGRFMTDAVISFRIALASVGATALIDLLQGLFLVPLHLALGTVRWGLHLGSLVAPTEAPFLFTWLQRIDLFSIWQYLAIGVIMAVWSGLHKKFGLVVGSVVYVVVQLLFAAVTLLSWFTSKTV